MSKNYAKKSETLSNTAGKQKNSKVSENQCDTVAEFKRAFKDEN
jgi:transposase